MVAIINNDTARMFDAMGDKWVDEGKRKYAEVFICFLSEQGIREIYEGLFNDENEYFGFTTFLRFAEPEYYMVKAFTISNSDNWVYTFNDLWLEKINDLNLDI